MSKPLYILIAAMAEGNRVIGNQGKLPWNLPEDLQNFKRLTTGGTIVMGRKTYESIGRPLPNRRNIVLSSGMPEREGVEVFSSIESLVEKLSEEWIDKVFIIGGQKIYEEFLDRALIDEVWLSRVPGNHEGDAYLVSFEQDFFEETTESFETFSFVRYKRKN